MSSQRSDPQASITRRRFLTTTPALMLVSVPATADDDIGKDIGAHIEYRETKHIRNAYRLMRF